MTERRPHLVRAAHTPEERVPDPTSTARRPALSAAPGHRATTPRRSGSSPITSATSGTARGASLPTSAAITCIATTLARLSPLPDLACLQEVETQLLRSSTMNLALASEETQLDRLMTELYVALAQAERPERYVAYYFPAHTYYRLTSRTNIYTTGLSNT